MDDVEVWASAPLWQGKGTTRPPWLWSIAEQLWAAGERANLRSIQFDLSNVRFVTFYEWVSVVAFLAHVLTRHQDAEINLQFVGKNSSPLPPPGQIRERARRKASAALDVDADALYRVVGFADGIGTESLLTRSSRTGHAFFGGVDTRALEYADYYAGREVPTIVNGLTRVASAADCSRFLTDGAIIDWRKRMNERFRNSPLFASDEVWRVFCHELATNIWEHAGTEGVIGARVVEPVANDRVRQWCLATFGDWAADMLLQNPGGILELCVADAGDGIASTLMSAFTDVAHYDGSPEEVVAFAFEDIGTSKDRATSWITERHALARILRLVQKYRGALTIRTGEIEMRYAYHEGGQRRMPNGLGYRPAASAPNPKMRGTHLQLLLPLYAAVAPLALPDTEPPARRPAPDTHRGVHSVLLREYVPLSSVLNEAEHLALQKGCERIAREIALRVPAGARLVLSFEGLNWSAAEFETVLHFLESILQTRPALLAGLPSGLAHEVVQLEADSQRTHLSRHAAPRSLSRQQRAYGELTQRRFLDNYQHVHSCVIGVDVDKRKYLFGVADSDARHALLTLLHTPASSEGIVAQYGLAPGYVAAILNGANPAFERDDAGRWKASWTDVDIDAALEELARRGFDSMAVSANAWSRRRLAVGNPIFHLAWEKTWLHDFLEASRILSNDEYVDEIARRLIVRLESALRATGRGLDDVSTLAALTSPAALLATALHRWWPLDERPSIADVGHYIGLGAGEASFAVTLGGGIVIVQDVLDTLNRTNTVADRLSREGRDVLATVGMVRLIDAGVEPPVAPLDVIALFETQRPSVVTEPVLDEELRANTFWIEPRTLQPFRFDALLRRYSDVATANSEPAEALERDGQSVVYGHYVYGRRHTDLTVDVQRVLEGPVGHQLAMWIADLCDDTATRVGPSWESVRGRELHHGVTAVLMPLHSQINYVWERAQSILARRGVAQQYFILDTTLFLTEEGAYQLPTPLRRQLMTAARTAAKGAPATQLRFLILDDAITSARTAETIIAALESAVEAERERPSDAAPAIEWIRYFAVLNKLSEHRNRFWRELRTLGAHDTSFVFEFFVRCLGMHEDPAPQCYLCSTRDRLQQITRRADLYPGADTSWTASRLADLAPVPIDTANFRRHDAIHFAEPFVIANRVDSPVATATTVATAIWRFREMMEMAVPPRAVLKAMQRENWSNEPYASEAARYRYAVLSWLMRHWERVAADDATVLVADAIEMEIASETNYALQLLADAALLSGEPAIRKLVRALIDQLITAERSHVADIKRITSLDTAITTFFLALPEHLIEAEQTRERQTALSRDSQSRPHNDEIDNSVRLTGRGSQGSFLLRHLNASISDAGNLTFSRNLLLRLSRPLRHADARWALTIVAESLYRSREERDRSGAHRLLPYLLNEHYEYPEDDVTRSLLLGSASLFLAALKDLAPYTDLAAISGSQLEGYLTEVCAALASGTPCDPNTLIELERAIDPGSAFDTSFGSVFHAKVQTILDDVREQSADLTNLDLQIDASAVSQARVLTHVGALTSALLNWAAEPARDGMPQRKARIAVKREEASLTTPMLEFHLVTNFKPLTVAAEQITRGRHAATERIKLDAFGTIVSAPAEPDENDIEHGYTTKLLITVPAGFVPRDLGE